LPPAHEFLSAISHPPIFRGGVSDFTGLDRVNAYPSNL